MVRNSARIVLISIVFMGLISCAGTLNPFPGMEIGFDASVEGGAHTNFGINREETSDFISSGPCALATKFNFSWLQFVACPPAEEAEVPAEVPAP